MKDVAVVQSLLENPPPTLKIDALHELLPFDDREIRQRRDRPRLLAQPRQHQPQVEPRGRVVGGELGEVLERLARQVVLGVGEVGLGAAAQRQRGRAGSRRRRPPRCGRSGKGLRGGELMSEYA